jgi:hypothetical protein
MLRPIDVVACAVALVSPEMLRARHVFQKNISKIMKDTCGTTVRAAIHHMPHKVRAWRNVLRFGHRNCGRVTGPASRLERPLVTFWRKIDVFGSTVNGLRPSKDRRAAGGHF